MSRRRATHSVLANAVDDPEERARHLALACDGPDDVVAGVVEQAARGARARGAPDTAAELSELAVRLTSPGSPVVDERRLELAEHLHLAGDFEREARFLDELRETLAPGDLRARALLMLGHIDFWRAGESAALALADEALLVARDPLVQARCHALIAMWAGTIDVPKAASAAEAALVVLEPAPDADPGLLALALSARVRADLFLGDGLDVGAAERALALEARALPASVDRRVVFKLGQWLRYVDDLDGARLRLAEAELSAREEGDESSLANILLNRVLLECWAGEWQRAASQWTPGKNFDGTMPIGPELVTTDEIDVSDVQLTTRLNGEVMQSARTSQMIFDIPRTIEFLSSFTTLRPGDVIATGTPGGVGFARQPPVWLQPGDEIEIEIEGVGRIANRVIAEERDADGWPWIPPVVEKATL